MRILTPAGYKNPAEMAAGDEVCAFDISTGSPIINTVENIDYVDYAEWCRWWQVEASVPPFNWVRINGLHELFCEQSIWRNGQIVCHARDLVPGDEIYDSTDRALIVTSVELFEDKDRAWYRFDISGDHSYIVDDLTVHNASRFWVLGTGTWDSSTTTHWAATSGAGSGGASVPGSADTVTFDGSSGGGTVTLNFGGTITIQSLTMGAFTGTFDNSVNNNNITVSNSGNAFNWSGSGTRTYKLGTATYTLTSNAATLTIATATGLTYSGNTGCTITFPGTGARTFTSASALSHGNVIVGAASAGGSLSFNGVSCTVNSLSISPPNVVQIASGITLTITNAFTWVGTSTSQIGIMPTTVASTATISAASGSTALWCAFYVMTFSGNTPVANSSFNLGGNTGITINAPLNLAPAPLVVTRGTPY